MLKTQNTLSTTVNSFTNSINDLNKKLDTFVADAKKNNE